MICSFNFLICLAVCLNISTVINIKILANSNQQTQRYKFNSHIAAFVSVVLFTEMLEICIQTSYDQNVQLMLKSYLPVVYGTPLTCKKTQNSYLFWKQVVLPRKFGLDRFYCIKNLLDVMFNDHFNMSTVISPECNSQIFKLIDFQICFFLE